MGFRDAVARGLKAIGLKSAEEVTTPTRGSNSGFQVVNVLQRPMSALAKGYSTMPPKSRIQGLQAPESAAAAYDIPICNGRQYFDLFDYMIDRDPVIAQCVQLRVGYMLARPHYLEFDERDRGNPKCDEVREFFAQIMAETNSSYLYWSLAQGKLQHGTSTNEIIWKQRDDMALVPDQFIHCHPGLFEYDRRGNIYLAGRSMKEPQPANSLQFVRVVAPALYSDPWGNAALYGVRYQFGFTRDGVIEWIAAIENQGSPIIVVDVDKERTDRDTIASKAEAMLANLTANSGLVTKDGEKISVHPRAQSGLGGSGKLLQEALIDKMDEYKAKRLLGATLSVDVADRGARSLGTVHADTVLDTCTPDAIQFSEGMTHGFARPLVRLNFGPDYPMPRYLVDMEKNTDAETAQKILETAVNCNIPTAVAQAQTMLGLREPKPGEALLSKAEGADPSVGFQAKAKVGAPKVFAVTAKIEKFAEGHSYATTQFNLSPEFAALVSIAQGLIPRDALFLTEEGVPKVVGYPHCTLLYGITTDDPSVVQEALATEWPVSLRASYSLEVFECPDFDVLVIPIDGSDLRELRTRLAFAVPHVETKPEYRPHVTLAYLKKGTGRMLQGSIINPLMDCWMLGSTVTFSDSEGNETQIALTGPQVDFAEDVYEREDFFAESRVAAHIRDQIKMAYGSAEVAFGMSKDYRSLSRQASLAAAKSTNKTLQRAIKKMFAEARTRFSGALQDTADQIRHDFTNLEARMEPKVLHSVSSRKFSFEKDFIRMGAISALLTVYEVRMAANAARDEVLESQFAVDAELPEEFQEAVQWMESRGVMTASQVADLANAMAKEFGGKVDDYASRIRREYLQLAHVAEKESVKKVQGVLSKSIERGESFGDFLNSLESALGEDSFPSGLEGYWRTVYNTEMANAYSAEQEQNEGDPDFQSILWGHEGYNPRDDRSRKGHARVNGVRFKKGSRAWTTLGLTPFAYSCRCIRYALTKPPRSKSTYRESSNAYSVALGVERF